MAHTNVNIFKRSRGRSLLLHQSSSQLCVTANQLKSSIFMFLVLDIVTIVIIVIIIIIYSNDNVVVMVVAYYWTVLDAPTAGLADESNGELAIAAPCCSCC